MAYGNKRIIAEEDLLIVEWKDGKVRKIKRPKGKFPSVPFGVVNGPLLYQICHNDICSYSFKDDNPAHNLRSYDPKES
jgi:hypothetical protein